MCVLEVGDVRTELVPWMDRELGWREGSYANTVLALLLREGGSTSEHRDGLCAVVLVSHDHLGATACDSGSVGECAN